MHTTLQPEFAATVERHWDPVLRVAWCLLGDSDLTIEVVTATFLALRDAPDRFAGDGWLRLALYRDVIDRALSAARPRNEHLARLHAAIAALDHLDRMAFVLRFVEKLPDAEAAAILRVRPEELRRRSSHLTAAIAVNAVRRSGNRRSPPERRKAWHDA